MKNYILIGTSIICLFLFSTCKKEITEPEHTADGSNVVYVKVDDKEEFLLDDRNKRLHKKTAGKFDDYDDDIAMYNEFTENNQQISYFSLYFLPFNSKKAAIQRAAIILRFADQKLDTAFFKKYLNDNWSSIINFHIKTDEYREYHIDSIIDYKIIKLDTNKKILTFSANCTYSRFPKDTPPNPKIYFYIDIKY